MGNSREPTDDGHRAKHRVNRCLAFPFCCTSSREVDMMRRTRGIAFLSVLSILVYTSYSWATIVTTVEPDAISGSFNYQYQLQNDASETGKLYISEWFIPVKGSSLLLTLRSAGSPVFWLQTLMAKEPVR